MKEMVAHRRSGAWPLPRALVEHCPPGCRHQDEAGTSQGRFNRASSRSLLMIFVGALTIVRIDGRSRTRIMLAHHRTISTALGIFAFGKRSLPFSVLPNSSAGRDKEDFVGNSRTVVPKSYKGVIVRPLGFGAPIVKDFRVRVVAKCGARIVHMGTDVRF